MPTEVEELFFIMVIDERSLIRRSSLFRFMLLNTMYDATIIQEHQFACFRGSGLSTKISIVCTLEDISDYLSRSV